MNRQQYLDALRAVLAYVEARNYRGYSKYDALNSPLVRGLTLGAPFLKFVAAQSVMRFPFNIRPLLGVEKSVNPKGIGVFALTYLHAAEVTGDTVYVARARSCLDWLLAHSSEGYSGICWGYDHEWPNFRFSAPKWFPNLVVTGNCALAFIQAYEQLGEASYLEVARDTLEFIRHDLNVLCDTPAMKAYSYIPGNDWTVVNPQGLAATLMSKIGKHTGEQDLLDEARRLMAFLVDKQTAAGAWFYAHPSESSPVKHDNYHSGNVLDWVLLTGQALGTDEWLSAFRKGLAFYRDDLFTADGAPKYRHDKATPYNAHGSGQGAITFARAAIILNEPEHLLVADRILDWALANLRAPDGHFYYERTRWHVNKTSLMRWNQAWMACGLVYGLLARKRLKEDGVM